MNAEHAPRLDPEVAVAQTLWHALSTYSEKIADTLTHQHSSDVHLKRVVQNMYDLLETAAKINLSPETKRTISASFLDHSLDFTKPIPAYERQAAVDIGLTIGAHDVDAQITHIALHHRDALREMKDPYADSSDNERLQFASQLLDRLKVDVRFITHQSIQQEIKQVAKERGEQVVEYARGHVKTLGTAGTALALTTTLLAPSAANAASLHSSPSSSNVRTSVATMSVSMAADNEINTKVEQFALSIGSDKQAVSTMHVGMASTPEKEKEAPKNLELTLAEHTAPTLSVSMDAPELSPVLIENMEQNGVSVELSVPKLDVVASDTEGMTKAQRSAAKAQNAIAQNGDVYEASFYALQSVRDSQSAETNGISSEKLLKKASTLNLLLERTVKNGGHENTEYVNNALSASAILNAVSKNQSVLDVDEVKAMIKEVKRPSDAYQARLYDAYLSDAKKVLEADKGAVLEGIDQKYHEQIEAMYAYVSMAGLSDNEQQAKIDVMKAADAKIAAEKKAAEEAAAAAKAGQSAEAQGADNGDISAEALNSLIENAPTPVEKRMFMAMQHFMQNGFTSYQAAGMVGNMHKESGSTMDPSIHQFGGGPGRGMIQWEIGGRFDALDAYAKARGKTWDDFYTQLDFVIHEMQTTRSQAYGPVKQSKDIYGATYAFMRYFETPYVVIEGLNTGNWSRADDEARERTNRGAPLLKAFNDKSSEIQGNREAAAKAAQAAKEAEAAKQAQEAQAAKAHETANASPGDRIAAVAEAELAEWERGEDRPTNNQDSGTRSYIQEYTGGPQTHWCAYFVNTVLKQAGIGVEQAPGGQSIGVVNGMKQALAATGEYTWHPAGSYVPKKGDIAFYGDNDNVGMSHINIVTAGSSPYNYASIGGNQGNSHAPAYASKYGGQPANNWGDTFNHSYVTEYSGVSNFGEPVVGFMSHN